MAHTPPHLHPFPRLPVGNLSSQSTKLQKRLWCRVCLFRDPSLCQFRFRLRCCYFCVLVQVLSWTVVAWLHARAKTARSSSPPPVRLDIPLSRKKVSRVVSRHIILPRTVDQSPPSPAKASLQRHLLGRLYFRVLIFGSRVVVPHTCSKKGGGRKRTRK